MSATSMSTRASCSTLLARPTTPAPRRTPPVAAAFTKPSQRGSISSTSHLSHSSIPTPCRGSPRVVMCVAQPAQGTEAPKAPTKDNPYPWRAFKYPEPRLDSSKFDYSPKWLSPHVAQLRVEVNEDASVVQHGLKSNAFVAFTDDKRAVLVDVFVKSLLPAVKQVLAEKGAKPVALLITHRHVLYEGTRIRETARELNVPVYIGKEDAEHPQGKDSGLTFKDPQNDSLLKSLGIYPTTMPGHTFGATVYHFDQDGGVLFPGDNVTGPTWLTDGPNEKVLYKRPPFMISESDDLLKQSWTDYLQAPRNPPFPFNLIPFWPKSKGPKRRFKVIAGNHGNCTVALSHEEAERLTRPLWENPTRADFR